MSRGNRSQAADRARFEKVYGETRQAVLAYLLRRTESIDDAADLLSEVYLVAWRRIGNMPAGEEARLWLFGVARRLLANHRRRTRTGADLAAALMHDLSLRDAQRCAEREPAVGALGAALDQLSPVDRELLLLSGWEELTPTEIAVVVGSPAALVRVKLHRARTRLRTKLAEIESTPQRDGLVVKRRASPEAM